MSALAAQASANEILVSGTTVQLPLTKVSYHKGKFLSAAKSISIRAYDTSTAIQVDWAKLEAAEGAKRRALYGAWNLTDLNLLKLTPQKVVRATLWLDTRSISATISPSSSTAALITQISQLKNSVRGSFKGTAVVEIWHDPAAPIMVVQGDAKSITALGYHPTVGRASLNADRYASFLMADGQERLDMSYPYLVRAHGAITNEAYGPIVMWDGCVPSETVTVSDPPANKYLYIPIGSAYTNPYPPADSACRYGNPYYFDRQTHSSMTLGIVAGRKDTYVLPGDRGIDGFHPGLPNIHIATVSDMDFDQPGAEIRVPHLSAVGTYVQSVDPWWRTSYQSTPPFDPPYVRCDKQSDTNSFSRGTSFAAPQVAGLAAYAMRWARCLYGGQTAVQVARALLIASSDRQVSVKDNHGNPPQAYRLITGLASYDDRRWAAGAGAVNAGRLKYLMGSYACAPSSYVFAGWIDPNDPRHVPPYGTHTTGGNPGELRRCRFALTWPPHPSCAEYQCNESRGHDLDLLLYTAAGQFVGSANSYDNNYEFMDIDCPAATQLQWFVNDYADPGAPGVHVAVVGYDTPL